MKFCFCFVFSSESGTECEVFNAAYKFDRIESVVLEVHRHITSKLHVKINSQFAQTNNHPQLSHPAHDKLVSFQVLATFYASKQ